MEDVPQPADEPYEPGDKVRIYLSPNDPDSHHHGQVCKVKERLEDNLDEETGRELDKYIYRLVTGSDNELPITPRHQDLVPHQSR